MVSAMVIILICWDVDHYTINFVSVYISLTSCDGYHVRLLLRSLQIRVDLTHIIGIMLDNSIIAQ